MDCAQFEREKERGAAFAIASRLLRRGLITEDEHRKLTAVLGQKYRPMVSPMRSIVDNPIPKQTIGRNNYGKEVS